MTPRTAAAILCAFLLSPAARAQTNITCTAGGGLQCTPNPITGTGSIAVSAPLSVANGGTARTFFTAGSIPFSSGTALSENNANLFWDNVANRLRTPLQDRGGQVFNVTAYGAKGDGMTDDTASIQTAITAAGAATVYLPKGNYKVSAPLRLPTSGSSLIGAGVGATVITTSSANANVIEMGPDPGYAIPGVAVAHLSIGSSVERSGGNAIRIFLGEQYSIDNVRIGPMGGNGINASGAGGPNIVFVTRVDIEIKGSFSAVLLEGGGEFQLSHAWLRGPVHHGGTVAGSVGIDLRDGHINAFNVEAVQFERGVYIHPAANQTALWSTFVNVLADTNALYGWHIAGSGAVAGIQCFGCWAGTNGNFPPYVTPDGSGFRIENGDSITLINPRVINNGGNGIDVFAGTKNLEIAGGFVTANSAAQPGYYQGIAIEANTKSFRIHDVKTGTAAGGPLFQGWGIFIVGGCDNYIISGNDTQGNVYGGINNVPGTAATRILAANL